MALIKRTVRCVSTVFYSFLFGSNYIHYYTLLYDFIYLATYLPTYPSWLLFVQEVVSAQLIDKAAELTSKAAFEGRFPKSLGYPQIIHL